MNNLMRDLFEQLTSIFRTCPVHSEIKMEREIFDEDLFMYEYHCHKCNIWYSSRVLDIMELEK